MTRRAARVDANHEAIVAAFRAMNVSVVSLAEIGKGVPDLLCSFYRRATSVTYLVEVKDGAKSPSHRALTPAQAKFHASWPGRIYIVTSVDDVAACVVEAAADAVREWV